MKLLCPALATVALGWAAVAAAVGWVGIPLHGFDAELAAVTDVIGEASSAAADTLLEGDGFDLGGVTERCSSAPDNEVIGQDPAPSELAPLGSLVNVLVSNGVPCKNSGRPGVRLPGLRLPGV